jgi:hypothetical protein
MEGFGVVVPHDATKASEDVALESTGLLELAEGTHDQAKPAGFAQGLRVVVTEDATEAGDGVVLELSGLLVLAQGSA